MANKMTKRDYFTMLLTLDEVKSNDALVAFIKHEVELLNKKNSAEKKPTAQQVENERIKDAIFSAMVDGQKYTITDIQKSVAECADLTGQKISALIRQMTLPTDGRIIRTEEKRKAYFSKSVD